VEINISLQSVYNDLTERTFYRDSTTTLLPGGSFHIKKLHNKEYIYHSVTFGGRQRQTYIGPHTAELMAKIKENNDMEMVNTYCRDTTRMFISHGYKGPPKIMGNVLEELALAGFFRMRGVLVGTLAFQCYAPMLGAYVKKTNLTTTADVDIAQFHSISVAVNDCLDPTFKEVLNRTGNFEKVPPLSSKENAVKWFDKHSHCYIDVLTPMVGKNQKNIYLPSIGEYACGLRYLDFLIYNEIKAVVLHHNGINVNIPDPARFAVHKIIISTLRDNPVKRMKDIAQADFLCKILYFHDKKHLQEIFEEACNRGPKWRKHLKEGIENMDDQIRSKLSEWFLSIIPK